MIPGNTGLTKSLQILFIEKTGRKTEFHTGFCSHFPDRVTQCADFIRLEASSARHYGKAAYAMAAAQGGSLDETGRRHQRVFSDM